MKLPGYSKWLPLAGLAAFSGCSPAEKNYQPNVVLIFMDDLGYGDLGTSGATGYQTPNLDRMASEGMRFTHFYSAQAVCSASRAGILTGCYPNRIGITGALGPGAKHGIHPDELTVAEMLKARGYATGIFGKWHLGHHQEFLPLQHGFDEFTGLPYSNDMWPVDYDGTPVTRASLRPNKAGYPPLPLIEGNEVIDTIGSLQDQDRLTGLFTRKAVDFIERHAGEPFFLYLPHPMVHVPQGVSDHFRGQSRHGFFGDVMMEVDWSVGQILETLRRLGIEDNTLVIFTSDNGPWLNYGNHAGNSGGLREGKGTSFEGGQRVPCLMLWPGVIPAGVIANQLASTIDIMPTLAEITGASLPVHPIDGVSILSVLKGENSAEPRTHFLYYYNQNSLEAVRMGSWKLVLPHPHRSYIGVLPGNDGWPGPYATDSAEYALYDLKRDPGEQYDVKEQHPRIVEEIERLVEAARADLGDDLTGFQGANRRLPGRLQ